MTVSKEQNIKRIKFFAMAAIITTVVTVLVRSCCLTWFYDEDIGYYTRDVLPVLFYVLSVASVVLFSSVFVFVKPFGEISDGREDNVIIKVASGINVIAFSVFFVFSVLSSSLVAGNVTFDLISKISSLMAVVYFAVNLFGPDVKRSFQTVLGFGIIAWCICVLGITYFDIYVQLNSPEKIGIHLALISVMGLLVCEFRAFVDRVKSKLYLACACASVFFCGVAAVPSILHWVLLGFEGNKYISYVAVLLALFIYSLARLVSFALGVDKRAEIKE